MEQPVEVPVTGVALRWFAKGYGFIKPDDGGEDMFCHCSSITDGTMLKEGAAVQFVRRVDEHKGTLQAYGRPYSEAGKPTGTYYKHARSERVPSWVESSP